MVSPLGEASWRLQEVRASPTSSILKNTNNLRFMLFSFHFGPDDRLQFRDGHEIFGKVMPVHRLGFLQVTLGHAQFEKSRLIRFIGVLLRLDSGLGEWQEPLLE